MAILNDPAQEAYELRMANRLWGQTGYGFLPKYEAVTRQDYETELAQVDFSNEPEQVRGEINAWVQKPRLVNRCDGFADPVDDLLQHPAAEPQVVDSSDPR